MDDLSALAADAFAELAFDGDGACDLHEAATIAVVAAFRDVLGTKEREHRLPTAGELESLKAIVAAPELSAMTLDKGGLEAWFEAFAKPAGKRHR